MSKWKRCTSLLIIACLLMTLLPTTASAQTSGSCGKNVYWEFDDATGILTISGAGDMYDYNDSENDDAPWEEFAWKITAITVQPGITHIGNHSLCYGYVSSIDLPEGLISIGDYAFIGQNITTITLPNSLRSIGSHSFANCTLLSQINIPERVVSIGDYAFSDSGLTRVSVPGTVSELETSVFYSCDELEEVVIGEGVTSIGDYTFANCCNLSSVDLPDSLVSIGACAFSGCYKSLENVVLPNNLVSIGGGAFGSCSALTSIAIPESVTILGGRAFFRCNSLSNITLPNNLNTIGANAFAECEALQRIHIPESVISIGEEAFSECPSLTRIDVAAGNAIFCSDANGFLYSKDMTRLLAAPGAYSGSYTIPDGVTEIGPSAFSYCEKLIGVTIPDTVTTIGYKGFCGCSALTSIRIPEGITAIQGYTFWNCDNLKQVAIPSTVREIHAYAFDSFTQSMQITDIYFSGSEQQWAAISVEEKNSGLESAVVHFNTSPPAEMHEPITLVRYLREWDAENRIAYFDNDSIFGALATDASVLPENIAELAGQYVLATTRLRTDGVLPPDEIISLYPVETGIGTVTASDEAAMTIEINGKVYSCGDDLLFLGVVPGNEVLYHIYDGQVAGLEPLQPELGFIVAWDAESGQVSIEDDNGDPVAYTLSPLVDEAALIALGESRRINVSGVFTADHNRLLYELFLAPGGEYEWDPAVRAERENWYNAHAEYARSEYFAQDVVQGFTGEIQETLETICDNPIIPIYRTLDSVHKLFHFDTEITDTQEYELLLAQVLFTRTGVQSLETLYQEYVPKSLIKVCDVYMNVLEEVATMDEGKLESFRKALQNFKNIATGAAGYESALNELLRNLDDLGKLNSLDELIKGLEQGQFTFLVNFVSSQIGTTIDTFKDMAMYLAAAEAYALTAETFGEMLLEMRRHINIPSDDPRYRPYGAASMLVDDYMIWEELGIEHANAVNCPVYLSHLAAAIEDIYELLEASRDGDADYIGGRLLAEFVDDTGFNAVVAEIEVCWSLLNCIPFVRLAHQIRSLYDGYKFAIDVFTDFDEKEYHGVTVQRLYAISYVHYLTVNDLAQNVPAMEEGASEQECYEWATMFDEAVTAYRSILSTAADYAIEYAAAVYNVSKEDVWSEPHKHMFPNIHTTMGSRIWCLKLEKEILSVPWCHDREATEEIYNRYATSDLVSFTLKCPIRVVVRDEAGTPVAVLSDGRCVTAEGYEHYFHVTETASGSGEYLKIAVIPNTYTISVTGTGEGSMDAVVTELPGGEIGKSCHFYDIPIHWDSAVSFTGTDSILADGVAYPRRFRSPYPQLRSAGIYLVGGQLRLRSGICLHGLRL